jgi:cobalamin biosynthesis protein CobD/CbiB
LRGPALLTDAAALYVEPRFNRTRRGDTNRLIRGLLVVMVVLVASIVAGGARGPDRRGHPLRLGSGAVRTARPDEPAAAAATNGAGDDYAVARVAIERLTHQLASGLIAASFWYVLLGLLGLAGYLAVNRLAARLDVRDSGLAAFGFAVSRLNEALSFLPGILAGFLIVVARVFVPGANQASAYRTMLRDFPNAHLRAMGFAHAALAGAFAINLRGPDPGRAGWRGWVGDGNWRARATSADVRRRLYIHGVVCLLHMALIALLAMATFAL